VNVGGECVWHCHITMCTAGLTGTQVTAVVNDSCAPSKMSQNEQSVDDVYSRIFQAGTIGRLPSGVSAD